MKVLVTGAAGFLGQRVVRRLLEQGHGVRAFVRPGRQVDAAAAERVEGDLQRREDLERALDAVDAVVHCAARVQTAGPWQEFEATNVEATRAILAMAADRPVVHVSSLSVYDVARNGVVITEDSPYESGAGERGHYSRSKLEADRAAMAAAAAGQPVTVVRPGLLYGPGRRPPLARQSFAVGPYRFILGSNQYLLPLVHVDNVADAIALALTTPAARGRAYTLVDPQVPLLGYVAMYRGAAAAQWRPIFVSTGMVLPLAKAATALLKLARRRSPVTPHQIRRATDSARYDCSRAERELGWKSRVSLADGLRQSLGGSSAPPSSSPLVSKPVSE